MKTNTASKPKLDSKPTPKPSAQPSIPAVTIGIDMGDRGHYICAIDADGEIIDERKITNTRESLRRLSKKYPGARIVIEVGSHSPWTSRFLKDQGHEVIVANPRKLRAIYENDRKSDDLDAQMLARIGRLDPRLLYPIAHQGEEAQRDLLGVKLRDNLVRQRVNAISAVRFTLKSLGHRLPSPNTNCFAKAARKELDLLDQPELLETIEPSLQVIELLTTKIKEFDKKIEGLCEKKYPATAVLRQIGGVGAITALTYLLVIGDPERFGKSRDVGPYFGLVPKRDQSGGLDKELRISKAGNKYMRTLLVGAAQYILGPFGPDCDLRRRGLALAERGGRGSKKKAVVATARKLSVVMHRLWSTGDQYLPTREAVEAA
ncbi:MAG: IS110 family transposase [Verrucomicrobiales bacterium]